MTVTIRDYPGGRKEADIRFRLPNGEVVRKKLVCPVSSTSGARRWGEARERDLYQKALSVRGGSPQKLVPTFDRFAPRFIAEFAVANHHKPSGIASKQSVIDKHLLPRFGSKRLNEITDADIQKLKADLAVRNPKTVNNVLSVLNKMLTVAAQWGEIIEPPVRIRLLKTQNREMSFYEPADYTKLVNAAGEIGWQDELIVRLGGDAGLRRGEMLGARDSNVDFVRHVLVIQNNVVGDKEVATKGLKVRRVPLTPRLEELLHQAVDQRNGRVLRQTKTTAMTAKMLRVRMKHIQRRAGLTDNGALHILRHTFCSHLAMAGVPVMEIQRLAGHAHLNTTLRYMHLAPNANQAVAINKLDEIRRRNGESMNAQQRAAEAEADDDVDDDDDDEEEA